MLHESAKSSYPIKRKVETRGKRSLAQTLPSEVLVQIFSFALQNGINEFEHGGVLVGWDSNELAAVWRLVCRDWEDPASFVAFRSIRVSGLVGATSILDTIAKRASIAHKIRSLVIGLGAAGEETGSDDEAKEASPRLVSILVKLPNLTCLQIRPLHTCARQYLVDSLAQCQLQTLVCAPRLDLPFPRQTLRLFHQSGICYLALPTLTLLELDWTEENPVSVMYSSLGGFPEALSLTALRLHVDVCENTLYELLTCCSLLEIADLYFEKLFDPEKLATALLSSAPSLKRLSLVSNPTAETEQTGTNAPSIKPIIDRILPACTSLRSLKMSGTEASSEIFSLFPLSLRSISIRVFNDARSFAPAPVILSALADTAIRYNLQRFTVFDEIGAWTEAEVSDITQACLSRGIAFRMRNEMESSGSDNKSSSST